MIADTTRAKHVYFLFYAASAALLPVLSLYYQEAGLRGAQIGLLTALWPAGSVLGAAAWSALADATGRHRALLMIATGMTVIASQLLLVGSSFWTLMPIALAFALFSSPIVPIVDDAVLTILADRRSHYGRLRLWGAVGWGVSAPLVGLLVDAGGLSMSFPVYGVLMTGVLISAAGLPVGRSSTGANVLRGLRTMVGDPRWVVFLSIVLMRGIGGAFVHHYLFIYLAEIGGGGALRGVALAVATMSELAAYLLAERLVRRVGARRILFISLLATTVRLLLYSMITNPIVALAPQLLHGVTFALFLVAGVNYAREIAPEGISATAQAVFTSTNMGVGGFIGALLGGWFYELFGIRRMYLIAAGIGLIALVGFLVGSVRQRRQA